MNRKLQQILVPAVSSKYGAPMGRFNRDWYENRKGERVHVTVNEHAAPFNLVRIPIDSQGYDSGGAYWGLSRDYLYGFVAGMDDIFGYVWAVDRDAAKCEVRVLHPKARFYK